MGIEPTGSSAADKRVLVEPHIRIPPKQHEDVTGFETGAGRWIELALPLRTNAVTITPRRSSSPMLLPTARLRSVSTTG